MTDRELLELAARAAGLKIDKSPYNGGGAGNDGFDLVGNAVLDWHNGKTWNPLTDDGDAFRLAAKLWLEVRHVHGKAHAGMAGEFWCTESWWPEGDQLAATRRAITRAAAAIGKGMQP